MLHAAEEFHRKHDTMKCLEHAEFAMEQISRKLPKLLPGKEKFLQSLHDIVANAFLDQVPITIESVYYKLSVYLKLVKTPSIKVLKFIVWG